ncbi:hypothetical protein OK016_04125 [Vibrio chagasii]|nr:hypothetical protein [Vibrio chagasii]
MMGGVPTQVSGQAIKQNFADGSDVEVQGLFACGESS